MRTLGIIAEYNPFHNGHAWQIRTALEKTGADFCAALMSPDFVQRGEPAITDKYTRTRMALLGGADLVLELPVRYALAGAQGFARGAVRILDSLGCIDDLVFGCETDMPEFLQKISAVLADEPELYRQYLKDSLRSGTGFAAAREKALIRYFEEAEKRALSSDGGSCPGQAGKDGLAEKLREGLIRLPNNILALEYLNALKWTGSSMNPYPVRRKGAGYHDPLPGQAHAGSGPAFVSAEGLRGMIRSCLDHAADTASFVNACSDQCSHRIPPESLPCFLTALEKDGLTDPGALNLLLQYRLFSSGDFSVYSDISGELSSRILRERFSFSDLETFSSLLQTRQTPVSSVRRALMHILLELTGRSCQPSDPSGPDEYVRILGFRKTAAPLLRKISQDARIPVITKPASAKKLLTQKQLALYEGDLCASHLYQLLRRKTGEEIRNEYTHSPVIL